MNKAERRRPVFLNEAWLAWAHELGLAADDRRGIEKALRIPAEGMLQGFGSAWSERVEAAIFIAGSGWVEWARAMAARGGSHP